VHLTDTYFVIAHFTTSWSGHDHGVPRRNPFLVAEDHGRLYPEFWAKIAAADRLHRLQPHLFPQSSSATWGCRAAIMRTRRISGADVLSTAGASILAVGYLLRSST